MALPSIHLLGNLTQDPELRFTSTSKPVTSFRVACNDRRKDPQTGEWKDGDSVFLDVTVWNRAEAVAEQLSKGSQVVISGTLSQRTYTTKDGSERTAYEVKADEVALVVKDRQGLRTAPQAAQTPQDDPWANNAPF